MDWKDGVDICDGTYGRGGVCDKVRAGSVMIGRAEGVEGVDMLIDKGKCDDENGFEFVEKVVPFPGDDGNGT